MVFPVGTRPKKSKAGLVLAIIGGVLLVVVALIVLRRGGDPTVPGADQTNPTRPGAQLKAATIAQGKVNFTFQSYDTFSGNQIALARNDNTENVLANVFEFGNGTFTPAFELNHPIGKLNDINHGQMLNDGKEYAIVSAEKGIIVVPPDDAEQKIFDGKGIRHVLVGDWDGDGRHETLTVGHNGTSFVLNLWWYGANGVGEKLKSMGTYPVFPDGPQVISINDTSYLLGIDSAKIANKLATAIYKVDADKGLQTYYSIPIHQTAGETVTGYAAGQIAGRLTLVVAYQSTGGPSSLELFDISGKPNPKASQSPPSRGKMALKDGRAYQVMSGFYTQKQNLEILLMDSTGDWSVIGF